MHPNKMNNNNRTFYRTITGQNTDIGQMDRVGNIPPYKGGYIYPNRPVICPVIAKKHTPMTPHVYPGLIPKKQTEHNIQDLVNLVAEIFEVDPLAITTRVRRKGAGPKRNTTNAIAEARFVCMHFMQHTTHYNMSTQAIGEYFGLERTAASYGSTVVTGRIETYKDFALKISIIKNSLNLCWKQ